MKNIEHCVCALCTPCHTGPGIGLRGIKSFTFTRKDDFPELLQFVSEVSAQ